MRLSFLREPRQTPSRLRHILMRPHCPMSRTSERFMARDHVREDEAASRELLQGPPGFGVRQSSGASGQASTSRKRQRTAALQDVAAPEPAPSRFLAGEQVRKEQGACREPGRDELPLGPNIRAAQQRRPTGFMADEPVRNEHGASQVAG